MVLKQNSEKKWILRNQRKYYNIWRKYYMQKKERFHLKKDRVFACKRKEEDKILHLYNLMVLPHLYQTELSFRSHD